MPFDGLLYLAIFGSQVRGTERPDSDLDVLFVTRTSKESCYTEVRSVVTETPGGVKRASIIPHIPETITRMANVYGSIEYRVLRERDAETLYRSADFGIEQHPNIDYAYSAERWFEKAETYIFPKSGNSNPLSELECVWLYNGIDCLLRASLMSVGVEFPDTRDLRVLHDMLPPDGRPPLDLDVLAVMREKLDSDEDPWSHADAQTMSSMARNVYGFVATEMGRVSLYA